jgi:hypothetical protein
MNPIAKDIADKLATGGLGTFNATSGWSIHIDTEPPTPHTTITVIATPSPEPLATINRGTSLLHRPQFQIRTRGGRNDYQGGFDKAKLIEVFLDRIAAFKVGTVRYPSVAVTSEILALGWDEKHRMVWVQNFRAHRTEA